MIKDFCWFARWSLVLSLVLSVMIHFAKIDGVSGGSTWQGWTALSVFWAVLLLAIWYGFREQRRRS